jgi:hypothetical protein
MAKDISLLGSGKVSISSYNYRLRYNQYNLKFIDFWYLINIHPSLNERGFFYISYIYNQSKSNKINLGLFMLFMKFKLFLLIT